MKRILALVLAMILLLSVFVSCKKQDTLPEDTPENEPGDTPDVDSTEKLQIYLKEVLPDGDDFVAVDVSEWYPENVNSVFICDAGCIIVVTVQAYASELSVMCGIDADGKIVGTKVLNSDEISDYGKEVFPLVEGVNGKYKGASVYDCEPYIVSGATATSKAYGQAVKTALEIGTEIWMSRDELTDVNLLDDDLSQYVEISENVYKGYTVPFDFAEIELSVEQKIASELYKNRKPSELYGSSYLSDTTIAFGDAANIYYRGYTLNEDGTRNYFDGGCNFNSAAPHSLGIGSGQFIEGFEYGLIGANEKDYAKLEKITTKGEKVESTDIVLITYSATYGNGDASMNKSAVINLADPNLGKVWGIGFASYWTTHDVTVGSDQFIIETPSVKEGSMANDVYTVTVSEVYRIDRGANGDKEILEVTAYFPDNYGSTELAGKTAYFEVFIRGVRKYDVPEFDEKFITETLKVLESELWEFEGDTLVIKYKNMLKKEFLDELAKEALAEKVIANAEIKKYPEKLVKETYDSIVSELKYYYQYYYASYYKTFDAFCTAYFESSNWRSSIFASIKSSVEQQLVLYRIMHKEGLKPSEEEYERMFDEYLVAALENKNITPETYENYELYLNAKENVKKQLIDSYGEDYFRAMIYYSVVEEAIIGYANFVQI